MIHAAIRNTSLILLLALELLEVPTVCPVAQRSRSVLGRNRVGGGLLYFFYISGAFLILLYYVRVDPSSAPDQRSDWALLTSDPDQRSDWHLDSLEPVDIAVPLVGVEGAFAPLVLQPNPYWASLVADGRRVTRLVLMVHCVKEGLDELVASTCF